MMDDLDPDTEGTNLSMLLGTAFLLSCFSQKSKNNFVPKPSLFKYIKDSLVPHCVANKTNRLGQHAKRKSFEASIDTGCLITYIWNLQLGALSNQLACFVITSLSGWRTIGQVRVLCDYKLACFVITTVGALDRFAQFSLRA